MKLLRKFENKMNNNRSDIEKELKATSRLINDFDDYKTILDLVESTKDTPLPYNYRQAVVPRFRENIGSKYRFSLKPAISFVISIIVMFIGYYLFYGTGSSAVKSISILYSDLLNENQNYLIENYDPKSGSDLNDFQISKIDSLYNENYSKNISASLLNSEKAKNNLVSELSLSDLDNILSDDEVESIYAELYEKRIY